MGLQFFLTDNWLTGYTGGEIVFRCEARNYNCPPGDYTLGEPRYENQDVYGPWFISLEGGKKEMGIHGGGRGLPDPLADYQGWSDAGGSDASGSIVMQNALLKALAGLLQHHSGEHSLEVFK